MACSVSHGIGLVASLVALPVLVLNAVERGDTWQVVGGAVFGTMLILLYAASTLYHACPPHKGKALWRVLDHSAIYLLIAGTYTPFTLGVLRGPWGYSLLAAVWTLAIAGITLKMITRTRNSRISIALYVIMGWLAVVAIKPILTLVPVPGILLIFAGGIAYTGGLAFFAAHRLRYNHFIWHLFVIAGTVCHFFAVLWYAA